MLALLPSDRPLDAEETPHALDALHHGVLEDARRLRVVQVRLARRLLALRRAPSLYRFGATTFSLYCESIGLSAGEGRDLASLAEAALVRPDVVPRFAAGRLSLGKVSALSYLLRLGPPVGSMPGTLDRPGNGREGRGHAVGNPAPRERECSRGASGPGPAEEGSEKVGSEKVGNEEVESEKDRDWVRTAEGVTTRDLWRLLEERRERQRLRESPEFVAMFVSRRGREDFLRCRDLVSRREWLPVTEGATLERVCDTFLGKNDPERRAARLAERDRKRGPVDSTPTLRPDSGPRLDSGPRPDSGPRVARRHIPAALQRDLIRHHGDRCWVDGCDRRCFLEFAHRVPVRFGGGEGPDNLLRLCGEHHGQFDGGGWRLIPRRDGAVLLIDRRGVVVGRLRETTGTGAPHEEIPVARETAAEQATAGQAAAKQAAAELTASKQTAAGETVAKETVE